MKYALATIFLFTVFTSPTLSQDGIKAGMYYTPTNTRNYPFLSGASTTLGLPTGASLNETIVGSSDCCAPLLPTLAQGIRDTINAILPCRGIRRQYGHGLLFSARFYEGSCCNHQINSGEMLLGPAGEPTPATDAIIPEEIEPGVIEDSVRFRPLPSENLPNVSIGAPVNVRPVSGRVIINAQGNHVPSRTRDFPVNPLRP